MERFTGLIGVGLLLTVALAMSSNRRRVRWRIVIGGILMQFVLALLVLQVPMAASLFDGLAQAATRILSFTDAGAEFVLGRELYTNRSIGFVFAFHVLPTIIFFASFMAVLYHLGVMQVVVRAFARVMNAVMGVSGAESLSMAANVFVGQTEAPLVVRPFVPLMTRSELMTLMTGGFSTIAGSVFAAYVAFLGGDDPAARVLFAKHLLTASVMSAPAAFVISKIIMPETEESQTAGTMKAHFDRTTINVLDAATSGAADGLRLAANVGAMLLALIALIAAVDFALGWIGELSYVEPLLARVGVETLSLKSILGLLFFPLAWAMGIESGDVRAIGSLLGEKLVATEFVAYASLGEIMSSPTPVSMRSEIIAAYALCGFANFGSIAIQLGGIGGIAPTRRHDLARLGLRAMLGGAMASFMTASIAGMMIDV